MMNIRNSIVLGVVAIAVIAFLLTGNSSSGTVTQVAPGGDLQAAIDNAQPGDVIELQADADYSCNCTLPVKSGSSMITIRSSRAGEIVGKVNPATQSALLARVHSLHFTEPVFATVPGAHHYSFVGLELTPGTGGDSYGVVRFGDSGVNQDTLAEVPHHLTVDRCWVHAGATQNVQRGITLNSADTAVVNSYISGIHWVGVEAQAVGGWNGPGPFLIDNNYLEAAGINVLFGGAKASITNLVPSDITISNNYLFKPLSWRVGDPSFAGIAWTEKNLLELKNARRVTISSNLMENAWPDAQTGWAIIFNAFNDAGWEVVEDVVMSHNVIRNAANAFDLRGTDATSDTACDQIRIKRITFSDNLFSNIGAFNGEGKGFQLLNGSEDVTLNHNTSDATHDFLILQTCGSFRHVRFSATSNLARFGTYGIFGDGGIFGTAALDRHTSSYTFQKNALYAIAGDQSSNQYPATNYFPATVEEAAGLLGVDGLLVGVRSGGPTPTPTPVPSPTPSPTATPANVCRPNQLISTGCTCTTKVVGPANKRRCK